RKARALGSGCLVIDFRHCGRDRDDSRASLREMRCESGMEVSPDVVLCDASVQYMFCGAKDFATLIIDFSSVGATSAPGQTRSFGDVGFDVRFARKRTRLGDSTRPSSPDPSLSELSRSYLGSGALASRIPAKYIFSTVIKRGRGRAGPSGRGRSIPGPRGPSALVPTALLQPSACDRRKSARRNFRIENVARRSADNIRTNRQLQPRPRPQIDGPVVRGKTPESRMPFGEVPIKPGSANGGFGR